MVVIWEKCVVIVYVCVYVIHSMHTGRAILYGECVLLLLLVCVGVECGTCDCLCVYVTNMCVHVMCVCVHIP